MPKNNNNNYNHTELIWDGKFEDTVKLPSKRVAQKIVLPFQTIEVIDKPREGTGSGRLFSGQRKEGWSNKLIWGDNKLVMASLLKEYAGEINLIYIDPPFDVGADFSVKVKVGDEELTKEPSMIEEKAYRDTWGKGTNSYLQMMYERLLLMRELLAENGSIYVHCDWRVNSYLKLMMDEIFSGWQYHEIIWVCGLMGSGNVYPKSHETILFYRRSESVFNMPARLGLSQRITGALQKDEKGWYYTRGQESSGGKDYLKSYISDNPNLTKEETIALANQNRPQPVWDVWMGKEDLAKSFNDSPVGTYAYTAKEKVGYPTQKPEALLERIIKASSNKEGIIADFFCGSGTTGATAERLGRRWIMCDLGRFAIHTSRKRLMEVQRKNKEDGKEYYPFEILNLGKYERQHWQTAVVNGGKNTTEGKKINQYLKFIIELYRGELVAGFTHLHGKKDRSFVHIGAVDAPVTMNEIRETVEECKKNKFTDLDVLGWEWEMGVNEEAVKWAKSRGVRLRLLQIPREVMDKRATEDGDVKFFELDYVEAGVEKNGQEIKIALKNFAIPSEEFIPNELREKIANWSDYIDYWSVDWDYASKKDRDGNYIFENDWQTFRTKKNPKLELSSPWHKYEKKGKYLILVKVIDIFGNDTSKIMEQNSDSKMTSRERVDINLKMHKDFLEALRNSGKKRNKNNA